jgi:protein-L-isoaspartate(D-aspartate) O-methyltransferase
MGKRELARSREEYAQKLRRLSEIKSPGLIRAFATVPREAFLGPGPWRILLPADLASGYRDTPDDDPRHLYENVLVAIDEARRLNNGEPAALARWLDALELASGDRVVHIGCGVGYYTAIAAVAVRPVGSVLGVESDPRLAARARRNLAPYDNAAAVAADGSTFDTGPADAIFVNAGATHPLRPWLDRLREGGRLLVPLTVALSDGSAGVGHMLEVRRTPSGYEARFISPVGIFHCAGARTDEGNDALRRAYQAGGESSVRVLRLDSHRRSRACWLHAPDFCLAQK